MITAVDTNVLLDILLPDPVFGGFSADALDAADAAGALVVCEPVYAELAAHFSTLEHLDDALSKFHIKVEHLGREAAFLAGRGWRAYRQQGGKRDRILTDFFIGAHARVSCSRLLTRDRGFYRKYFKSLTIIDPTP